MPGAVHTRLFLARHCDVRNPDGVVYGHLPDFPLSALGRRQAEALATDLAERNVRHLVSSPLERAQETARIIASHLDGVEVEDSQDLVEAKFGFHLQGVRPRDVPWRRPLWFVHMVLPGVLPNDETVAVMAARVRRQVLRALREHPGESTALVSHGDPIQAFWIVSEGRSRYALHRLGCMKGGMLVLDYHGEQLTGLQYVPPQITTGTASGGS